MTTNSKPSLTLCLLEELIDYNSLKLNSYNLLEFLKKQLNKFSLELIFF